MSLKSTNKSLYDAIEHMLQGLSYWMGYKMECYSGHGIIEGVAISAGIEILSAHLDHSIYSLKCEYPYHQLSPMNKTRERADLVIVDKKSSSPICVIEFKMSTNTNGGVQQDVKKLSGIRSDIFRLIVLLSAKEKHKVLSPFLTAKDHGRSNVILQNCTNKINVIRATKAMESPLSIAPYRAICLELL